MDGSGSLSRHAAAVASNQGTGVERSPAIWFPAIASGTGVDHFTERLVQALRDRGIRAAITWLPLRAEYAPWTVRSPQPPAWANICHSNTWLHTRLLPVDIPLVATVHHCVDDPALNPYKTALQRFYHKWWIRKLEQRVINRAVRVAAVSAYTAKRAASIYKRPDIVTIHNGIGPDIFHPDDRDVPNEPFRLLFIGTLSKRKGADLLPLVMERLGAEFELHYTGCPTAFGHRQALPANMIHLGRLEQSGQVADLYRRCDALLFPSRLEGFGLAALEAQACGRPVIATDGSALSEVVERDNTGILCPADDVDAFVTAARRLRADRSLWLSMGRAASRRVRGEFSEERVAQRYLDLYRSIL
ncbi:MAG: glycosyltransferase [Proteobacteria bacterium]|nr:MAG: glycosyltransferase [Pseudomonadota bacterium]